MNLKQFNMYILKPPEQLHEDKNVKHVQFFTIFNISERINVKKGQVVNKRH